MILILSYDTHKVRFSCDFQAPQMEYQKRPFVIQIEYQQRIRKGVKMVVNLFK